MTLLDKQKYQLVARIHDGYCDPVIRNYLIRSMVSTLLKVLPNKDDVTDWDSWNHPSIGLVTIIHKRSSRKVEYSVSSNNYNTIPALID